MSGATITFNNKSTEFISRVAVFSDTMMGLMATAMETQMKTSGKVPFLTKSTKNAQRGALRQSIRSTKLAVGKYAVTAGTGSPAAAYAAAQEAGTTRGFPMRNYSTSGTGPGWFKDAIDTVKSRSSEYAVTASNASGLGSII